MTDTFDGVCDADAPKIAFLRVASSRKLAKLNSSS